MTFPTYELFYGTGGHSGPYTGYETAKDRAVALLKGSHSEQSITIRPRTADGIGGYGESIGHVWKWNGPGTATGKIFHQFKHYEAHEITESEIAFGKMLADGIADLSSAAS